MTPVQQEKDPFFEDGKPPISVTEAENLGAYRSMEERKDSVLFKFDKPGVEITGHIAAILRTKIEGRPGVDIFLSLNGRTNQFVKIHATRQLLEKVRTTDLGRLVRIIYKGENTEIKTAGNAMRIFQVLVDTKSDPREDLVMDTSLIEMFEE